MLTDVAVTPIAETVRRLSAERRSGDLQVRSGRMAKIVFFDHGRLVFAASNLRRDRLGEGLVADGRITQQEFERVSSLMRADQRRRFGEALVHAGVMDRYEVGTALARQVRRIALSLFTLPDGAAVFEERECPIPLEYMVSLSVHRLLYDGIRQMKSEALILKGLGPLDRCVVLAEVPPFSYEPKSHAAEELEILELAQRRVTVRRLAWSSGGLTVGRLRATYALLGAGLLQEADAKPESQPVLQTETGMFLLSAFQSRPDPDARESIRREVEQELALAGKKGDGWLQLARTVPPGQLVKALEEKMERYHELREAVPEEDPLRTEIELVLGRAASALRQARRAAESASGAAQRESRADDGETIAASASGARRKEARQAGDAARAASGPDASAPRPSPAAVASAMPANVPPPLAAAATLPGELAPRPRKKVSETSTQSPLGRPDESIRMAPPGSSAFEGQALVEHLLMEGEVRMTVADYANAVKVYDKLVETEPRVAAYHLRLATAMVCYPRTAKLAEREFYEAARLEPDNAEIHYQWGLYYKLMKVKSRAVAEMRNAVRLNPRHLGARTELAALSPKDSALTSLKKLFR